MTRREVEQWVTTNKASLAVCGVRVMFGFTMDDDHGGPSWVSFLSPRGSGRFIRESDGSARIDAYAFADGSLLRRERAAQSSSLQLDSLAELLAGARLSR